MRETSSRDSFECGEHCNMRDGQGLRKRAEGGAITFTAGGWKIRGGGPGLPASSLPLAGIPADLTEGGQPVVCWPEDETPRQLLWLRCERKNIWDPNEIFTNLRLRDEQA